SSASWSASPTAASGSGATCPRIRSCWSRSEASGPMSRRRTNGWPLVLMALLVITGVLADERAGRSAAPLVVLGYYPSWRTAVAPDQIDYRLFPHLTHAFVRLDAAGSPAPSERIPSRELAQRAHQAKVKVLLAFGGADSNRALTQAARDAADAEQLAGQLVDL